MYHNIGKKIKGMAWVALLIVAVPSLVAGIVLMINGGFFIPIGLLVMFVGPVIAWISSWLLYGFGELIDKTCDIERNTRNNSAQSQSHPVSEDRIANLERLRSQGLITEEEYQQAISKR